MTTAPQQTSAPRLLAILARSATLRERLDGLIETSGDGPLARARLDRWCQLVGGGNTARLHRRLEWDGLSLPDALAALGEPRGVDVGSPRWLGLLAEVLAQAAEAVRRPPLPDLGGLEPSPPFEEVLRPFVEVAGARLYARINPVDGGFGSGGRLGLEAALMARLSALCGPALYRVFNVRRATATSALDRLLALGLGTDQDYQAFVQEMLGGGLEAFFTEHAVLARLAATQALDWVDWASELMLRLAADRPQLTKVLAAGVDLGQVTSVSAALSDPHHGGHSVLRLGFDSGHQVVYKPRDVGMEMAYAELVGWLNQQGADPLLRAPGVIARDGYGWVEQVEQQAVPDAEAARRYYRRAGMLLALFYGLGSTDCHQHNLVAAGEHPVLVDAETLLHPRVLPHGTPAEVAGARTAARRWMEESVLEADFLPAWTSSAEGRRMDISALGGVVTQRALLLTPRWEHVNSDAMTLGSAYEQLAAPASAVHLEGRTLLPWEFGDQIVEGFRALHRLLEQRRDLLLAPGGPLEGLRDRPVRFIVRPTLIYQKLLDAASTPSLLSEAVERGIELDLTARALLDTEVEHPLWPLHAEELAALERMDIPRFTIPAGSRVLGVPGGSVEHAFAASPLEHSRERLERFDENDRERQVALVHLALQVRSASAENGGGHGGGDPHSTDGDQEPAAALGDGQLFDAALNIGERLERTAISAPDGGLAWIGLSYDALGERLALRPVGPDLYSGQCGIALFLSALASASGEERFRELALRALRPVLTAVREGAQPLADEVGIGGATGVGSVVYGLVACARVLKEPELLACAQWATRAVTPERVDSDRELDVVAGSAGALLGLLSLHEATGSEEALSRVALCAEHLLARRTATPTGFRAWRSHSERPLAGFAHGAAGISYALLRASVACERSEFRAAAEEGTRYEAAIFDAAQRNWPDLRPVPAGAAGSRQPLTAWCHGAAGVGLARLGGIDVYDTPQVRADVMAAILTTRATAGGSCDQVCCGAMGRVEVLAVAGSRLSTPQLNTEARELASSTLAGAERRGGFRLAAGRGAESYSPGFFQGLSGIGYQLLRLTRPDLPSVPLFQVG